MLDMSGSEITLSAQAGCNVYRLGPKQDYVLKRGNRVKISEVEAMKLVLGHTNLRIPEVLAADFGEKCNGKLWMTFVEGKGLDTIWKTLDSETKERLCEATWAYITTLRTIPRPKNSSYPTQCQADGSATNDPLLKDEDVDHSLRPRPIFSDVDLRQRIYERYRANGGDKYADSLQDMLPCTSLDYVFTHGDIAPRNILINEHLEISAVLDWENSGWYPHYWEYANIMGPAGIYDDWQMYMDGTAPPAYKCDLKGILAARMVLF